MDGRQEVNDLPVVLVALWVVKKGVWKVDQKAVLKVVLDRKEKCINEWICSLKIFRGGSRCIE